MAGAVPSAAAQALRGAAPPTGTTGSKYQGASYVDPDTGHVMNWAAPTYSGGLPAGGGYNDTGQVDPSWQKNRVINNVLGMLPGAGAGASSSLTSSSTPGGGGAVGPTQISPTDAGAADRAAMTAQKEQSGQALAGAAKTLRSAYNARGLTGSGQEAVGEQGLVSEAARQQTATGADLLRQSLDRSTALASENANLQEGYANRQTNYNVSQQQIALQAKIAAQTQLTDLLRTVGALV